MPTRTATDLRPFEAHVPEAVLTDLRERVAKTRWPDEINDHQWSFGTRLPYLRSLADYWMNEFDWRAQETRLNRLPQFIARVDDLDIHFIHQKSSNPNAIPLIITHGWPGSVFEFMELIPRLAEFDLVIPSLPGFGFSSHPTTHGTGPRRIADLWLELMTEVLGYQKFGAQGGDWGAHVTSWLGRKHADSLYGIHLNFIPGITPEISEFRKRWRESEGGYAHIQGTRPQTVAYALNDSPVGLCAWMLEKYRVWSDCGGDVETRFTKDDILTHVTLYWATQSISSSVRIYLESVRDSFSLQPGERIEAPTAIAIFPEEIDHPPREWVERAYNVQQWTEMPSGGHFAAHEEPARLADDIRRFFVSL